MFGARSEEDLSTDLLETVECTSKNQVFDVLLVALREVDTLKEVEEGGERPVLLTFLDDGLNGRFTHTLDGSHTKTNITFEVDGELVA